MRREVHIKCAPDSTEYSEIEFLDKWKRNGMQIKLIFHFRLKPWHSHSPELQFEKKMRWSYLTTLGFETDIPFGDPIPQLGPFSEFFQPIFKELIFKKLKRGLIIFQKLRKGLILFKKLKR
jgi:hypothetical protein